MSDLIATKQYDALPVSIYTHNTALGQAAAAEAIRILRQVLVEEPLANIIVATGNSQLTFYEALVTEKDLDWKRVNIFHMDEYVGLPPSHPASFRCTLREKLVDLLHPAAFFGVVGDAADPQAECQRYVELLTRFPAHLCCLGIGENGHLAFNDPPYADFNDPQRVKLVTLAERSRQQQVGEGHFTHLEEVPRQAITLTIPSLMSAKHVLAIVPELRKAEAVLAALTGPISADCPASILRRAPHAHLFLDAESAALLR